MAETIVDIVIVGSTPLARLLAGLLAAAHGRKVCLVAEAVSAFRMPRGTDISAALYTRPGTWELLGATVPELTRLLPKIGARSALSRVEARFVAEDAETATVLNHVRHVALGYGAAAKRLDRAGFGRASVALTVEDCWHLARVPLERALEGWLERSGVVRRPAHAAVAFAADGRVAIGSGDARVMAAQCVLADDAAILDCLPAEAWSPHLHAAPALAVLTEPTQALEAKVFAFVDRGTLLSQVGGRSVAAQAVGRVDTALARIASCLAGQKHVRRAGQVVYRALQSRDGAPLVGSLSPGAFAIAGLGPAAAFFAPAVARLLAGAASPGEAAYFADRTPGATGRSRAVDFERLQVPASRTDAAA